MNSTTQDNHTKTHWKDLCEICWRQWRVERNLRHRGIDFRSTDPDVVRKAYSQMTPDEFAAINGRHAWANARTLENSWTGLIGTQPLVAIDLGPGIGTSTQILARLFPAGSTIVGIEFTASFVDIARQHTYVSQSGTPQHVAFVVGSVAETFQDENGQPIVDSSVDCINASGVLGHHLSEPAMNNALDEVRRVSKPLGIAALDVGPKLPANKLTKAMVKRGFQPLRRTRGHPFDRTGQIVFQHNKR